MLNNQKIIFAPVSSDQGIGEYMRSLIIAQALKRKHPQLDLQFILNRTAPYVNETPFPVHLIDHSPTKEISAVNRILSLEMPDLIIFDCSGRAAQYRHAKKLGIDVVFISQHKRKRRRGFNLRRLPYISQHWIAQLQFVDGELNCYERIKQQLFGNEPPLFIGSVYDDSNITERPALDLPEQYIVYSSGGGGYKIKGENSSDVFSRAASEIYKKTGVHGVVILGMNYIDEPAAYEGVRYIKCLDNAELIALLNHAFLAVLSGGDLMSQSMSMGQAVVAVSVAKDQAARIKSFSDNQFVIKAEAKVDDICNKVAYLVNGKAELALLKNRVLNADIKNGLSIVTSAISKLLTN